MADSHLWGLVQSWMDGQIVRVNQSQLAEALGVNRQSLTQWKMGYARPNPENLRALRRVTRIDWSLLTDALLRDMGYVEEDPHHGTATTRAGTSPAHSPEQAEAIAEDALSNLPPEAQANIRKAAEGLRPAKGTKPRRSAAAGDDDR